MSPSFPSIYRDLPSYMSYMIHLISAFPLDHKQSFPRFASDSTEDFKRFKTTEG